jgi:hypothetical protein
LQLPDDVPTTHLVKLEPLEVAEWPARIKGYQCNEYFHDWEVKRFDGEPDHARV